MAHIVEHAVLSGWKGILNDVPLIVAVCCNGGVYVPRTSKRFRLHRFFHSFWFALFLVLIERIFRIRGFFRPCLEHILLDYLTHEKGWLTKDVEKRKK